VREVPQQTGEERSGCRFVGFGVAGLIVGGSLSLYGMVAVAFGERSGWFLGVGLGIVIVSLGMLVVGIKDARTSRLSGKRVPISEAIPGMATGQAVCPSCGQRTSSDRGQCQWCDQPLGGRR
jgi:hypothetical protein